MGQQLLGPLSSKLATQSAKRLIGPRGRSKGWLWWAWTRTSDPSRSPALLGPFLISKGLRQLEAHGNLCSCYKLPFYASADRGWPSDLRWRQHQAPLLRRSWMKPLLLSLFSPPREFLFSLLLPSASPLRASHILQSILAQSLPISPCNPLVRPGLSVLVYSDQPALGCGEKGPALSFQIWELPITLVSGGVGAPRSTTVVPVSSHRVVFPRWQGLQCSQNPGSCCLPPMAGLPPRTSVEESPHPPWGSAAAGARGVNPINICQVPAWCPAVLEGTLDCRGGGGGAGSWYGQNGFPEAIWAEILPSAILSQLPSTCENRPSPEQSLRGDRLGGLCLSL